MAMRSQVYEWIYEPGAGPSNPIDGRTRNPGATLLPAGTQVSIFVGPYGRAITKPAETTATQFIVVEDFGSTPGYTVGGDGMVPQPSITGSQRGLYAGMGNAPNGQVQIRINTTDYFLRPDGIPFPGIDGSAAPYPRSVFFRPSFNLFPDVYILPGQVWDVLYTPGNDINTGESVCNAARVFLKYTLYDGPDALIANKLLEMGITVNPGNVDWYKRMLIESGGVA